MPTINWMTGPVFGFKVACCFQCNDPLFRMRSDQTNRPAYYCPTCKITIDYENVEARVDCIAAIQ